MEKKKLKMNLTPLDDIFSTQNDRDNANLEKVVNLPIKDITDFNKHPFKVDIDEEMLQSVKDKGVLAPAIVRPLDNGKYEMIAGHRRKKASEMLELDTIPCIVRDLTDDEATIIMVDSNLQREKILPSEKAFAYKLKLEALSHQGIRNDLTSVPVGHKLNNKTSREMLSNQTGESATNIQRYVRLTYLIPKLLEFVDNKELGLSPYMAKRPAVEISYLKKEEQEQLLDIIEFNDCTPNLDQAIDIRKMSEENTLTVEKLENLMAEEKPNQTPKLRVSMNRLGNVLPNTLKNDRERENYVIEAVEWYVKYQQRLRERKAQER